MTGSTATSPRKRHAQRNLFRAAGIAALVVGLLAILWWTRSTIRSVDWQTTDSWLAIIAALAAMACALPGCYLLLRKQSMMGDAISHTVLLGIIASHLFAQLLRHLFDFTEQGYASLYGLLLLAGAVIAGVLTAVLTEWIQNLGKLNSSAALGIVFTSMFALALFLIRIAADHAHLDTKHVLFGNLEMTVLNTVTDWNIPQAAFSNGSVLLLNAILILLLFKELKISAFDSSLSTTLGINARAMQYGLMIATAASVVAVFESVGSIVVIAMLIVPGATASLLTRRLSVMLAVSLAIAGASAFFGHLVALWLPSRIFTPLGFPEVRDASTAGTMAVVCGIFFLAAVLFSPQQGIVSRLLYRLQLSLKVTGDDLLGLLYRMQEMQLENRSERASSLIQQARGESDWFVRLARWQLLRNGLIAKAPDGYRLTETGTRAAKGLVRAHRLWEGYLAKHFELPEDHLHESAHMAEHFINPELRKELTTELDSPVVDPHGREIPTESDNLLPP